MNKKQIIGLIGSSFLILAGFSTIMRVPILGGAEGYLYPWPGSAPIIIILGVTSLILTLKKKYKALWFTGIISLLILFFLYYYATTTLSKIRTRLEFEYLEEISSPEGLIDGLITQPVEFYFGSILLLIGGILIIIVATIKRQTDESKKEQINP